MNIHYVKPYFVPQFKDAEIISVSAKPGGPESSSKPEGLEVLINTIKSQSYVPEKRREGPALFSVDHCFSIKG